MGNEYLLSDPYNYLKRVIEADYAGFRDLEAELKPLCPYVDFHDYGYTYLGFDWRNKVVVDVGADVGSSAIYFIRKGARFVYLVENNPFYVSVYLRLKNSGRFPELRNTSLLSVSVGDIVRVGGDVLKVDCEGCEKDIIDSGVLSRFREWVVAIHKTPLGSRFDYYRDLLLGFGGVYIGSVNGDEFVFVCGGGV
ncbi:MAG: hypothetical protein QXV17_06920 [Candidatus Micrarchaeaceae archaeon]